MEENKALLFYSIVLLSLKLIVRGKGGRMIPESIKHTALNYELNFS